MESKLRSEHKEAVLRAWKHAKGSTSSVRSAVVREVEPEKAKEERVKDRSSH